MGPIATAIAADRPSDSGAPIARQLDSMTDENGSGEGTGDGDAALTSGISADVSSRAAAARAGISGIYGARIAAAHRSGMNAAQIAAVVRSIKQERQAAMSAAAEAASAELTGRMATAKGMRRVKRRAPTKGTRGHKPR